MGSKQNHLNGEVIFITYLFLIYYTCILFIDLVTHVVLYLPALTVRTFLTILYFLILFVLEQRNGAPISNS